MATNNINDINNSVLCFISIRIKISKWNVWLDNYNSFDRWTSLFFNKISSFELDWNTILKYNVFNYRKYTNENEDVADKYKIDESPVLNFTNGNG